MRESMDTGLILAPEPVPNQEIPDLELLVEERPGSNSRAFDLRLKARDPKLGLNYRRVGSINLRTEPASFFRQHIAEIWRGKPSTPQEWASFAAGLRAKGAFLSEKILPLELRQRLSSLRGQTRTLLVQSDDPWIPWEMLCIPENPADEAADGPFLCEAFAMTRWLQGMRQTLSLPLSRIATIVARDSGLSQAEGECRDMLSLVRGESRQVERLPARLIDLLGAFGRGEHDGWHFTGHGFQRGSAPDLSAIFLEDEEELTPVHLSGRAKRMGLRRPLVFLNACSSGRSGESLTNIGGWVPHFLEVGAGACIGALWPIDDILARDFARAFYGFFTSGLPIAEAVLVARQAIRSEGNPTWLAYTVFAHPLAICAPLVSKVTLTPSATGPAHVPTRTPFLVGKDRDHSPVVQKRLTGGKKEAGVSPNVLPITGKTPSTRRATEAEKLAEPASGQERINEKDGTVLVYVPGGELMLGAEGLQPWSRPVRRVRLSPFWIGKFPVTNEQYSKFLKENPSFRSPAFWEEAPFNGVRHPVVGLSWEEAQAYCIWAGLELPSEAQWEAAARGTDQRPYPWGKQPPTSLHANFGSTSGGTAPVDAHPAGVGPYGTFDQAGNVWEWCADPWASQAYQQFEDSQCDPIAKGEAAVRALRGGAWENPSQDLHAAYRDRGTAKLRFNNQGFRCVWRSA
jgi:formylglycine-generating enzyme required for sulfatase activity